jgi:fatty-acyl-CoA synthase
VAVYPVPDVRSADQVMAAVEMAPGVPFDPDAFVRFMAEQPDLGPKWIPSYVRVVEALPVTATDKLDKKPLRAAAWRTADPLWHRAARTMSFEPMTASDVAALEQALEENGRLHLIGVSA